MKKITVLAISAVFMFSAYAQEPASVEKGLAHWSLGIKGGGDYYRITPYGESFFNRVSWAAPDLFVQYDFNPYFGLGLDAGLFNYDRSNGTDKYLGKTIDAVFYGSVNLLNVASVNSPVVGLYANLGVGAGFWNSEIPATAGASEKVKDKGISPMGYGSLQLTFNVARSLELFLEGQYRSYTNQWMGGTDPSGAENSTDAITALVGLRFKLGAGTAPNGHARNMGSKTYQALNSPLPTVNASLAEFDERLRSLQNQVSTIKAGQDKLSDIPGRVSKLEEDVAALKEFNRLRELKEGEAFSASFSNIEFKFNSAELTSQSMDLIDQIANKLNTNTWNSLKVTGHTDNVGTAGYNKKLSKQRAESVKKYLVQKGVADSKITTDGLGSDKPLRPNDSSANRAKNRRVEFTVVK